MSNFNSLDGLDILILRWKRQVIDKFVDLFVEMACVLISRLEDIHVGCSGDSYDITHKTFLPVSISPTETRRTKLDFGQTCQDKFRYQIKSDRYLSL